MLKLPFTVGLYGKGVHVIDYNTNWLTGFCMVLFFTERYFGIHDTLNKTNSKPHDLLVHVH